MESEKNFNENASDEHANVDKAEKSKKSKRRSKNKKSGVETLKTDEIEQRPGTSRTEENDALANIPNLDENMLKTLKALKLDEMLKMGKEAGAPSKVYKFWNTQPVSKFDEGNESVSGSEFHKAIEPDKTIVEIKQDPYALPEGFVWETLDLENTAVLKELYTLLNENYVEDDDAMFRLVLSMIPRVNSMTFTLLSLLNCSGSTTSQSFSDGPCNRLVGSKTGMLESVSPSLGVSLRLSLRSRPRSKSTNGA